MQLGLAELLHVLIALIVFPTSHMITLISFLLLHKVMNIHYHISLLSYSAPISNQAKYTPEINNV